jgi:hypothetical protein
MLIEPLLNNRLFQMVVADTCINKLLPMQWIHMSQYILYLISAIIAAILPSAQKYRISVKYFIAARIQK